MGLFAFDGSNKRRCRPGHRVEPARPVWQQVEYGWNRWAFVWVRDEASIPASAVEFRTPVQPGLIFLEFEEAFPNDSYRRAELAVAADFDVTVRFEPL